MRRILLVLEDYNEQTFLETLLKKVGFDAQSIRSEASISEKMLDFSPDLVIATGEGHKINGGRVVKRVKKHKFQAKILLLFSRAKLKDASLLELDADGAVEIPLNPRAVIASVCQLTGIDLNLVMNKFDKLPVGRDSTGDAGPDNEMHIISARKPAGKKAPAGEATSPIAYTDNDPNRIQKYAEFLKSVPVVPENGFVRGRIEEEMAQIKKFEAEDPQKLSELDEQRKAFVRALFKK